MVSFKYIDGKRPDFTDVASGLLFSMVTITNTVAASYLTATSTKADSAAELAASRKEVKYQDLSERYEFVPIAI